MESPTKKLKHLPTTPTAISTLKPERAALEFADTMTITGRDVSDELFARLREFYDEDALIELTATIAWENASSKFNRALRVPSQGLWKRRLDFRTLPEPLDNAISGSAQITTESHFAPFSASRFLLWSFLVFREAVTRRL